MTEIDYKQKYLKFKKKYLDLKFKQQGGGDKYKCVNPNASLLKNVCIKDIHGLYENEVKCAMDCLKKKIHQDLSVKTLVKTSKFDRSKFDMSKFDMSKFVMSKFETSEVDNCIIVGQGEIALTDSENKSYILTTFGLGPCHCLIIYNTENKKGILAHIDSLSKLNILHNVFTYIDIKQISDVNIYIISGDGDGYNNTLEKIKDKLKILGLLDKIIYTNIGEGVSRASINTLTGEFSTTKLCKGYQYTKFTIPITRERELKKIYGFDNFIDFHEQSWYNTPDYENGVIDGSNKLEPEKIYDYPQESRGNLFENYTALLPEQQELLNLSKKFANKVVGQRKQDGPFFFVISGSPGIGKTHLSVSISKYVSDYGKKVIFINSKTISNIFQYYEGKYMNAHFDNWVKDKDLIIMDDINNIYGIQQLFFEEAFKYTCLNGKALLITSNIDVNKLFEKLYPVDFNINCVKIFSSLVKKSKRKPWTTSILDLENSWQKLCDYSGEQASGILILQEDDRELLQYYEDEYKKCNKKENIKIRKTGNPMKVKPWGVSVDDLYVDNAHLSDVVITKVFNRDEIDQFCVLIHIAHNHGIKLIVLIKSIDDFTTLLNKKLNFFLDVDENIRLYDRIRIIFPGIKLKKVLRTMKTYSP